MENQQTMNHMHMSEKIMVICAEFYITKGFLIKKISTETCAQCIVRV